MSAKIVAEIGVNHNGSIALARDLVSIAANCGASAVKVQFRDVNACYSTEKLAESKESPWGTTYGDYARGREFPVVAHRVLKSLANYHGMQYGVSFWDPRGALRFTPVVPDYVKIPSALATDLSFVEYVARMYRCPLHVSTGGCTLADVDAVYAVLKARQGSVLYHSVSEYPMPSKNAQLNTILMFQKRYPNVTIGWSDHSAGIHCGFAAALAGAQWIEVHFTVSRKLWGSDQSSSLEPDALRRLCRNVHAISDMMGNRFPRKQPSVAEIANLKRIGVGKWKA